ncbi:coproporphyrinogen III oxidase family protein (plasmid) [Bradyrhizobium sp. ISRA443]|uniref:coproporphyrinogen-III oxidase family protein n=1 Tax=unclassified Bradyrhizobium TaxID=2631580 RepID=UPI002478B6A1|nr:MULTISPECIES: coproporphyrinogen-III oxidase family protein [unclassified Bradyrhizobium]WGR90761.1 coproporphyrinogen III oxidase family protein [Bradyrhizobium sp. ISRA435]WGS03108.1 coproporphyrinogen III oxidase family protein [Bradyrhizobium sp. ISRA436]WGS09859.1 coproporphyrinogen III oxidase family protein [Bradyrhizobium sp. ISRA437]WGS16744.1 coproporphyrinogen III oxidase family protein [Bradyrhizobium sp. ISRA443]
MIAGLNELIARSRNRLDDLNRLRDLGIVAKGADFSPSGVHYPPITKYAPITEDEMFADYVMPDDGRLDVYAHIPFCKTRCTFCHYPLKLGPKMIEEKDRYLTALEKEMDLYLRRLGVDRIKPRSILVGGGTPTFLTPAQLRRFLDSFNKRVDLLSSTQFSYDVDPNTLIGPDGAERLSMMRDYGVHRLTIGIQSLNPEVLRLMNRHHGREEALLAIEATKKAGFQVNIEFIFGYPGQTLENWAEVVEEACQLDVEEIQLYRLKVEAYGDYQGPIKQVLEKKRQPVPTNEDAIVMKQLAIEILARHGYREQILRRVFTRHPEHYSHYAHNQCCRLVDEVGFGLSAFSSLRDRFVLNTADFDEYYAKIESGQLPVNRGLVRSKEDLIRWAVILPLKNRTIRERDFRRVTGRELDGVFADKFNLLKEEGLVANTKWGLTLTTLGCFFADEIVQQFFEPHHLPFAPDDYAPGPLHPLNHAEIFGSQLEAAV